jgi:hypothetical protein
MIFWIFEGFIMTKSRNNRGSALLLVVGLLTIVAMLGSTFLISSYMSSQQTNFIVSTATVKPLVMGSLSSVEELMKVDLHVSSSGPYDSAGVQWGGSYPETWRHYADYPSTAIDPWLSTTGGTEKDRRDGKKNVWFSMGFGPGAVAIPESQGSGSDSLGSVGSSSAGGSVIEGGVGGDSTNVYWDAWGLGLMVDTNGDGADDAFLNDVSVMNSTGDRYFVASRVEDLSGKINVNVATRPQDIADAESDPFGPYRIDLRRMLSEESLLFNRVKALRGTSETTATLIQQVSDPMDPSGGYTPFPVSDEAFLRINSQASSVAFDESEFYEEIGVKLGDRMYGLTMYSNSLKWLRNPINDIDDSMIDEKGMVRIALGHEKTGVGPAARYEQLSWLYWYVREAMGPIEQDGTDDGGAGAGVEYIVDNEMTAMNTAPGVFRNFMGGWASQSHNDAYGDSNTYLETIGTSQLWFDFTHRQPGEYLIYVRVPYIAAKKPSPGVTVMVTYPTATADNTPTGATATDVFTWDQSNTANANQWVLVGKTSSRVYGDEASCLDWMQALRVAISGPGNFNTVTMADAVKIQKVYEPGGMDGGGEGGGAKGGYGVGDEYTPPGLLTTGPGSAEAAHFVANMWAFMDWTTHNPHGDGYAFNPTENDAMPNVSQSNWCAYGVTPQLVISEVLVWTKKRSSSEADDSQQVYAIELHNPTDRAVLIDDYIVRCGNSAPWVFSDYSLTGSVEPGEYMVLYSVSSGADGSPPTPGLPGTECSALNNFHKAPIAIYRAAGEHLIPVDSVHGYEVANGSEYSSSLVKETVEKPSGSFGAMASAAANGDDPVAQLEMYVVMSRDDDPTRNRSLVPLYVEKTGLIPGAGIADSDHTLGSPNELTREEVDQSILLDIYEGIAINRLDAGAKPNSVADFSDCLLVGPDNNGWDLPHKLIGQRYKGTSGESQWTVELQTLGRRYVMVGDGTLARGTGHISFTNSAPMMYPNVPWGTLIAEFVDVYPAADDQMNPNGRVYGRLNINTATLEALTYLPWPISDDSGSDFTFSVDASQLGAEVADGLQQTFTDELLLEIDPAELAAMIIAYRDGSGVEYGKMERYDFVESAYEEYDACNRGQWTSVVDPDPWEASRSLRNPVITGSAGAPDEDGYDVFPVQDQSRAKVVAPAFTAIPGFLSPGEIAIPLAAYMDQQIEEQLLTLPQLAGATMEDVRKRASYLQVRDALYREVVDSVTVNSMTFAVTTTVLRGMSVDSANMEQYISVIDRTNCIDGSGKPEVLYHLRLDEAISNE